MLPSVHPVPEAYVRPHLLALHLAPAVLTACGSAPPPAAAPPPTGPAAQAEPVLPARTGTPAPATCGPDLYVQPTWPGEYPGPVVQALATVTLPARLDPCEPAPTARCTLPPGLYHPWANQPGQEFRTLSPMRHHRAARPVRFENVDGQGGVVELAAGDTLTVLAYLSEGICTLRSGARTFEGECPGVTGQDDRYETSPASTTIARQFFSIACPEGQRAWIEVEETLEALAEVQWGEIVGYGEVGPSAPTAADAPAVPSWVICLTAHPEEAEARAEAARLKAEGGLDARVLWIPDYGSLSGARQWLIYTGPYALDDLTGARAALAEARRVLPTAYGLKLDRTGPRVRLEPAP
jgi:hypothetical protein